MTSTRLTDYSKWDKIDTDSSSNSDDSIIEDPQTKQPISRKKLYSKIKNEARDERDKIFNEQLDSINQQFKLLELAKNDPQYCNILADQVNKGNKIDDKFLNNWEKNLNKQKDHLDKQMAFTQKQMGYKASEFATDISGQNRTVINKSSTKETNDFENLKTLTPSDRKTQLQKYKQEHGGLKMVELIKLSGNFKATKNYLLENKEMVIDHGYDLLKAKLIENEIASYEKAKKVAVQACLIHCICELATKYDQHPYNCIEEVCDRLRMVENWREKENKEKAEEGCCSDSSEESSDDEGEETYEPDRNEQEFYDCFLRSVEQFMKGIMDRQIEKKRKEMEKVHGFK